MKNSMKFLPIYIIGSLLFLAACTGEKGAVGPQGLAGVVGAIGDKGNIGPAGEFTKVFTGNATIKATSWIVRTLNVTDDSYYFVIAENQITKDILDKGIIMVYYTSS